MNKRELSKVADTLEEIDLLEESLEDYDNLEDFYKFVLDDNNIQYSVEERNQVLYHGTTFPKGGEPFKQLEIDQSSSGPAIWVTDDFAVADIAAGWSIEEEGNNRVIYQVQTNLRRIFTCSGSEFDRLYRAIKENVRIEDDEPTEAIIKFLKELDFQAWETEGNFSGYPYDDIAVFYEGCLRIDAVSFNIDNDWTDFYPIDSDEYKEMLKKVNED